MDKVLTKKPPESTDLENDVLGLMMQYRNSIDTVLGILTTESFYQTSNQYIFDAIVTLYGKGRTPDLTSVVDQLRSENKLEKSGGPYGISKLTNNVTSSVDIEGKCRRIQEKFILRELIRFGEDLSTRAHDFDIDAFDMLEYAESKILEISETNLTSEYTDLKKGMVQTVKRIDELQNRDEDITGVPSGFYELDKVTHGWQDTNLIVLAARPSVGKSAFALNIAINAATSDKKINVGFFSLEMSLIQLVQRILSAKSEIYLDRLKTGRMEEYQMEILLKKGVLPLENTKVFIDDTAAMPLRMLRSKIRRMVMKENVGLVIIDYLQLIEGDNIKGGNREQEISSISRGLKKLAKELKIPIIALAQLSRDIEKRASKIPVLSDLRESGAIEQDADIVGFIYRPSKEERLQDADLANSAMVVIAKNRDGELVDLAFEVDDKIQKWKEIGRLGAIKTRDPFIPVSRVLPPEKSDDLPF